ncbi:hypothetical protein B9L19_13315 [Geobacillus thermocatenulatus]|uniref:Uncharacterized protein n=1 Tax=Geobacillus thermocatenulatus TaxID=33938 RepID=A0AA91QKT2_9BACL|nr:hypothetical protein B9L19_13315 [Geobacillus thermocatenulatus]
MNGFGSSKTLSFSLFVNKAVIRNYTTDDFADLIRVQQESLLEDEESLNHAVLMEWRNPFKQT